MDTPQASPGAPTPPAHAGWPDWDAARDRLALPGALFVARDDLLQLRVHNSVASVNVVLRGRVMQPDGKVTPFAHTLAPTTDRASNLLTAPLGHGYLLSLAAFAEAAVVRRGQTFVQVSIVRGGALADSPAELLISDYLAQNALLGWPGGLLRQSVEGPGILRSITGTDPGAGVEISETVPTNARWRLVASRASLVTSVAAANRRVHVVIDDGASIMFEAASGTDQAASLTNTYSAFAGSPPSAAQDSVHNLPLPVTEWLLQGWRVRTVTTNLQAADNWGAPLLLVEEWIED